MSKVKNLEILASTLATTTMNKLSIDGSSMWMFANMMSEYNSRPNPEFKKSFRSQETEFTQSSLRSSNR